MKNKHPVACRCGSIKGFVTRPSISNRAVCYCKDCQAFSHYLGNPSEVLDQDGGTEIVQMQQNAVSITEGAEHLACMQLTAKGLNRWYASCCQTPIGNTGQKRNPFFVGLIHSCLENQQIESTFGPVTCRGHARHSSNPDLKDFGIALTIIKFIGISFKGLFSKTASPFFSADGQAVTQARVLSADERQKLRDAD